jgi:hypothetical protein
MSFEVTLPSQTIVTMGKVTVGMLNNMARGRRRESELLTEALETSIVSVQFGDVPIYRLTESGKLDWSEVLVGDRAVAKLALYEATYPGRPYQPRARCANDSCRLPIQDTQLTFNVARILNEHVVPYPNETMERLSGGKNRFDFEIGGLRGAFKLPTGRDQVRAESFLQEGDGGDVISRSLACKLVELDGDTTMNAMKRRIDALGADVVDELLDIMNDADGGIETTVEVECRACGWFGEFELPFEGTEFWMPSAGHSRRAKLAKRTRAAIRATSVQKSLAD